MMSELPTLTDPFGIILYLLIPGGFGAGIFEHFRNKWIREREELVEMAKFRMETISKKAKLYLDLHRYGLNYADRLRELISSPEKTNDDSFCISAFYRAIKFLQVGDEIFLKSDSIILSDQDAENIIVELYAIAYSYLQELYGSSDISKLKSLVDYGVPYHEFEESVKYNRREIKNFFNKFIDVLKNNLQQNKSQIEKSQKALYCLSDLLIYELNLVFELWYGKKFYTGVSIRPESLKYLEEELFFYNNKKKEFQLLRDAYPEYFTKVFFKRLEKGHWLQCKRYHA